MAWQCLRVCVQLKVCHRPWVKPSGQWWWSPCKCSWGTCVCCSPLPAVPRSSMQWAVSVLFPHDPAEIIWETWFRMQDFLPVSSLLWEESSRCSPLACEWQPRNQTSAFPLELSPDATMLESLSETWSQISLWLVRCWNRGQLLLSKGGQWPISTTPSSAEHPSGIRWGHLCFPCRVTCSWYHSRPVWIPEH